MFPPANDGSEDIIMRFDTHIFCWQGISTSMEQGRTFYPAVLGWQHLDDGSEMFMAPGGPVAHQQPVEQGPANWCSFLSVTDVDARTAQAEAAGGQVLVPPTDLPAGRFSVVASPSGAVFGIYQPDESDELAKPGPGSVHHVELQSLDVSADLDWMATVFGFDVREEPRAVGPYHLLVKDGTVRGGVTASRSGVSAFVPWVEVDDVASVVSAVGEQGGKVVVPSFEDPDVGTKAVVADPAGAVFGVVRPR